MHVDETERHALVLLARGMTTPQITNELGVSEATLRRIVRRARDALGANSTINAIYIATKQGLI